MSGAAARPGSCIISARIFAPVIESERTSFMASPPRDPPGELPPPVPSKTTEKERIESMTRSLRGTRAASKSRADSAESRPPEYRAKAVLSYHRFLGRWTAP